MFFARKTIFDILKEAEEDDNSEVETTSSENNETSTEKNDDNTNTDSESNSVEDNNDDFDIDTNLNDDDIDGDISSDKDSQTDTSTNTSDSIGDSSDSVDSEDKPVEANTNIFSSLSNEEQQIKISELKRLYNDLYCSCDDTLLRINDIDPDEDLEVLTRIAATLYRLKHYIADYMTNKFAINSYIENDVEFNRFLVIFNSVASVIEELAKQKESKLNKK